MSKKKKLKGKRQCPLMNGVNISQAAASHYQLEVHSTASWTLDVTWIYRIFGDRAFAAAGPRLWNSLPSHLIETDLSYNTF